jgi:hypothetical protein
MTIALEKHIYPNFPCAGCTEIFLRRTASSAMQIIQCPLCKRLIYHPASPHCQVCLNLHPEWQKARNKKIDKIQKMVDEMNKIIPRPYIPVSSESQKIAIAQQKSFTWSDKLLQRIFDFWPRHQVFFNIDGTEWVIK